MSREDTTLERYLAPLPIHLFLPLHVLFASAIEAAGGLGCRTAGVTMVSAGVAKARLEWQG